MKPRFWAILSLIFWAVTLYVRLLWGIEVKSFPVWIFTLLCSFALAFIVGWFAHDEVDRRHADKLRKMQSEVGTEYDER